MRELLSLVAVLVPLSIASIGGASSIYAPLQHQTVEVMGWLTPREFIELYGIARVTPGPGTMLATLIGFKVAGFAGAAVATLALFLPSSVLCYCVARVWRRYRGRPWHRAFERGLAPIGAGLMFAGVIAILRLGGTGALWPLAWGIAAATAALLTWRSRLHPFTLLMAGAALYVAAEAIVGGAPG
jgi:chromate transporter